MLHVTPGTDTTIDLPGRVQLDKLSVGPMDNNAYLLTAPDGRALLIDAAAEPQRLLAAIDRAGAELTAVVTTHRHHDHVGALADVVAATGAPASAGADDVEAIGTATGVDPAPLRTGDRVDLADDSLEVIELRGHTPGSVALVWTPAEGPAQIFTGDSLFPGGVGKTGSPADFDSLLRDVRSRLFDRFDDDTVIHPGHGDATTLGAERPSLDEWASRGW